MPVPEEVLPKERVAVLTDEGKQYNIKQIKVEARSNRLLRLATEYEKADELDKILISAEIDELWQEIETEPELEKLK